MSDDHAAHAIGAYGGRLASLDPTPNLDALAKQGTRFDQVFATNSICTPSRATILTGQYSQSNGVLDLRGRLPAEKQYLAHSMSGAGYETAVIGKWHLRTEPAAFDYYEVYRGQGDYFDPTFFTRSEGAWGDNAVTHEGHSTDLITDRALEWLTAGRSEKPFFLMLQYKAPHDQFRFAPRYADYLADTDIPQPVDLHERPDSFGSVATRGEEDALVREIGTSVSKRNTRRNIGIHLDVDPNQSDRAYTDEAYARYMKAYLRCVKGIDDNLGRVFAFLKVQGLWDNTIIVYTSDQGMMLGEHDLIDKRWIYEESIQMPFIMRHPQWVSPETSDLLINNTDFAPTLLEFAGASTPAQMQGRSFASELRGERPEGWRQATYYRYWMHRHSHDVPAHFGIRSRTHKLVFFYGTKSHPNAKFTSKQHHWPGDARTELPVARADQQTPPAWELYDLAQDPQELNNVYGNPAYATVTRELKAEMLRQRKAYGETDADFPHIEELIARHWEAS